MNEMASHRAPDGAVAARIRAKLTAGLAPSALRVVDESHMHAGHAHARPEGESHFRVVIESPSFAGLSRLQRHRRVNALLAEELAGPVHALAVVATAPGETE